MPYDLFVSDFQYDFSGIVGGYRLRFMCLHCIRARVKPKEDCTGIIWKSSSHHSLCSEYVRKTCGDETLAVQSSCSCGHSCAKSVSACVVDCDGTKGKRSKKYLPPESENLKKNVDPSHSHMRLP